MVSILRTSCTVSAVAQAVGCCQALKRGAASLAVLGAAQLAPLLTRVLTSVPVDVSDVQVSYRVRMSVSASPSQVCRRDVLTNPSSLGDRRSVPWSAVLHMARRLHDSFRFNLRCTLSSKNDIKRAPCCPGVRQVPNNVLGAGRLWHRVTARWRHAAGGSVLQCRRGRGAGRHAGPRLRRRATRGAAGVAQVRTCKHAMTPSFHVGCAQPYICLPLTASASARDEDNAPQHV